VARCYTAMRSAGGEQRGGDDEVADEAGLRVHAGTTQPAFGVTANKVHPPITDTGHRIDGAP